MKCIDDWKSDEGTTQSLRSLYRERKITCDPQAYLSEIHRWARERESSGVIDSHARWTLDDLLRFETTIERHRYLESVGCGDRSCTVCRGDGFVCHGEQGVPGQRCSACMPNLGLMFVPGPED
jgi:hypothetical protein